MDASPPAPRRTPLSSSPCRTPSPSSADSAMTPSPPQAPKAKRQSVPFRVKWILHSLEELSVVFMKESRKRENSKEALDAQRKRKLRILMSLR